MQSSVWTERSFDTQNPQATILTTKENTTTLQIAGKTKLTAPEHSTMRIMWRMIANAHPGTTETAWISMHISARKHQ